MKIIYTGTDENSAGGKMEGVLYFGTVYKVPASKWLSGRFEEWLVEMLSQPVKPFSDMEPVPGAAVELVETYVQDGTGDLWVVVRVAYRKAGTAAGRASR